MLGAGGELRRGGQAGAQPWAQRRRLACLLASFSSWWATRMGPAQLGDGQSQALPPQSSLTAVLGRGGSNVCKLLANLMP